jgi:hypothetical protein
MAMPVTVAELRRTTALASGTVDPNVKIPQHVIDAGKRSELIQRSMNGEAEPSVAAAVENGQAQGNGEAPPPLAPNGAPQEPPPPNGSAAAPQEGDEQPGQPVNWEERYRRLHGRHEADTRRAREAVNLLSQRLDQMERENGQLRATQPLAPPPEQPAQALTEQEIADYGPEFVDVMSRVAQATAAPLQHEIQSLKGQLGHVQQETGNAFLTRMDATISAAIPGWADLNNDPRFVSWSKLPDVFSGAIRKTLMQEAWNSGDAHRVVAFFQAFLAEEAATNPQGSNGQMRPVPRTVDALTPPAAPTQPQMSLETFAAPGRAHSAGSAPVEKQYYTAAQITKFYTDCAAGRWRGHEQQRAALDADIMLAQREGRIIPNPRNQAPRDPFSR